MTVNPAVERVLAGDREAFRGIVEDYGPCVRAFIAAHLPDPHVIDDLSQETFIAAFESLPTFDPAGNLRAWLKGIAQNKVLMHLREVRQHGSAMEQLQARVAENVSGDLGRCAGADDAGLLDRLRACLKKLPRDLQEMISARYSVRESVQSIADRHAKSVAAVSSLLFRGRRLLQACVKGGA